MQYKTIATTFFVSTLAVGAAVTRAENEGHTMAPATAEVKTDQGTTVVVLMPAIKAHDANLAAGCWARLYDMRDYGGNALTLTGPIALASTDAGQIAGYEIGRSFDSVAVGPKATLTVWDNKNFQDETATFTAGQKVPDLNADLGFFRELKSMKLACAK